MIQTGRVGVKRPLWLALESTDLPRRPQQEARLTVPICILLLHLRAGWTVAAELTLPHCPREQSACSAGQRIKHSTNGQLPALDAAFPQQLVHKQLLMRIPGHREGGRSLKVTQPRGSRAGSKPKLDFTHCITCFFHSLFSNWSPSLVCGQPYSQDPRGEERNPSQTSGLAE